MWSKRPHEVVAVSAENLQVEFYRRFEMLLARRGLVRRPNQTQLEFARFAGHQLAEGPVSAKTEALYAPPTIAAVRRLVDSFYRIRFGHAALDSRQAEAVEQVLDQLEQSVGSREKGYRLKAEG